MGNWSTSEPCSCFYSSCPNHHYLTQPMHLILDTLFLSAAHEQITYYQPALVNFCTQPCIIWFHWGESEIKTDMIFSYRSSKKELGEKEIKYNALKYLFNISVDWLTLQKCFTISTTKKPKTSQRRNCPRSRIQSEIFKSRKTAEYTEERIHQVCALSWHPSLAYPHCHFEDNSSPPFPALNLIFSRRKFRIDEELKDKGIMWIQ